MTNIIDNKYTTDHYSIGKYKEFQFFKPKKKKKSSLPLKEKFN